MEHPDLESVCKGSAVIEPDGGCSQIWPLIRGLTETLSLCQLVTCDKISGRTQGRCGAVGSNLSLGIRCSSRQSCEVVPVVMNSVMTARVGTCYFSGPKQNIT